MNAYDRIRKELLGWLVREPTDASVSFDDTRQIKELVSGIEPRIQIYRNSRDLKYLHEAAEVTSRALVWKIVGHDCYPPGIGRVYFASRDPEEESIMRWLRQRETSVLSFAYELRRYLNFMGTFTMYP